LKPRSSLRVFVRLRRVMCRGFISRGRLMLIQRGGYLWALRRPSVSQSDAEEKGPGFPGSILRRLPLDLSVGSAD
jgi:hypothetical protein